MWKIILVMMNVVKSKNLITIASSVKQGRDGFALSFKARKTKITKPSTTSKQTPLYLS